MVTRATARTGADRDRAAWALPRGRRIFRTVRSRIVVGLAPGGITDVTARVYAEALGEELSAIRVIVENRPGAGGAVAAAAVQNAAARRPHAADLLRLAACRGAGDAGLSAL